MTKFIEEKIELGDNPFKWYIIQTYNSLTAKGSSFFQDDRKKAENLRQNLEKSQLASLVEEVFVPIEEKRNVYTGENQYINLAPGYIFVKMVLTHEVKSFLSENQNKFGLIMGGYNNPHIVPEKEVENMKRVIEKKKQEQDQFAVGDLVKINYDDFTGFVGIITEILEDGYVNVSISIFGRNTSIKCSIKDLEKTDGSNF